MTTKTEEAVLTNAFSALGKALGSAAEKLEAGTNVALQSAKKTAAATGEVFAGGVYNTSYWISYGFVYTAVYLTELLPEENSFRRGLEEGTSAAQTKIHAAKKTESDPPSERAAIAKPKGKNRRAAKRHAEKETEATISE
jgi:hypothetical protein